MKFLIVGLGSMGKRRIRCLKSLGHENIIGFDLKQSRRKEAEEKYGIETISDVNKPDFNDIDALIISTPPDIHNQYIKLAIEKGNQPL